MNIEQDRVKVDEQKAPSKLSADLFILAKEKSGWNEEGSRIQEGKWRLDSVLELADLCSTHVVNIWSHKKTGFVLWIV